MAAKRAPREPSPFEKVRFALDAAVFDPEVTHAKETVQTALFGLKRAITDAAAADARQVGDMFGAARLFYSDAQALDVEPPFTAAERGQLTTDELLFAALGELTASASSVQVVGTILPAEVTIAVEKA